jgi:hypothetical protein
MCATESLGDQHFDVGAEQFGTRASKQLLGLGVDEDDFSASRNNNYGDRGGLDNEPQVVDVLVAGRPVRMVHRACDYLRDIVPTQTAQPQ